MNKDEIRIDEIKEIHHVTCEGYGMVKEQRAERSEDKKKL